MSLRMLPILSYLHSKILTDGFSKLFFSFVFQKAGINEAAWQFLFLLLTKDKDV